jgi:hypothetical protein
VNSFAEYAPEPNPETKKKDVVWFALNDDRPLFAFAGIWTEFKGDRGTKSKPVPGPHLVYGFLTTAPNAVVEPIHPKAMPVQLGGLIHFLFGLLNRMLAVIVPEDDRKRRSIFVDAEGRLILVARIRFTLSHGTIPLLVEEQSPSPC